jgi:DNA-methyltransferase
MTYSPLRYPGGKNRLAPFIGKICFDNKITEHYVEPYSGGASVALFLLFEGFVEKITINDKDRSIYAFWYSVLNQSEELCNLIEETPITINEWKKQKEVQKNTDNVTLLELGFSTFFLNRTNRSGIIKAGVIGGYKQENIYKLDCRFNKEDLIKRILQIASVKDKIDLYNDDALILIDKVIKDEHFNNMLLYFDPPYYEKGSSLYMNYYKKSHHQIVCEKIKNLQGVKWIVSYDDTPEIRDLYSGCIKKEYSLVHTAAKSKEGKEILFFSSNLQFDKNKNPLKYKLKKMEKKKDFIYIEN